MGSEMCIRDRRHSSRRLHIPIARVFEPKGICHPVEKGEQGGDVNPFGNLGIGPAGASHLLYILGGILVSVPGKQLDELQEHPLRFGDRCRGEFPSGKGGGNLIVGSLQLQEIGMGANSVGATIQPGDESRDHLLRPPVQMPVAEVDPVAERHHLLKKVRSLGEALQNARELLAIWIRLSPGGNGLGQLAGRVAFGNPVDEGHIKILTRSVREGNCDFLAGASG